MSSTLSVADGGMPAPELSQGAGYGVIVGLGALFAIVVVLISKSLVRWAALKSDAEEFAVARRSLGTGLTASAVVSSWIWSVTLLSSCSTAYNYGVAGGLAYAASNTTQIFFFGNLAVQIKRVAPRIHTHLELIKIRYGVSGHLTLMLFGLVVNILVCSSVLVGSAAAIQAITGVNPYASLFLLPTSVVAYTLRGGLRSTILADFLHTFIIFVIVMAFFLRTYTTLPEIGSPSALYDLVVKAAVENPAAASSQNYQNSYLTGRSVGAIKFAVLSLLEYSGVVLSDSSFYQKGIAARPDAAMKGYFVGGLSWFSIPFCLATTVGLVTHALQTTSPRFPTYPRTMTAKEVSAGLALPYAGKAILGKGGSAAVLLLMFMSTTSAISAQLVAVSTICAYDFYPYIHPKATAKQTLLVNHISVVAFGVFMAAFACLLHGVGVDLGFLYNFIGVFSGGPIAALLYTYFNSRLHPLAVFPGVFIAFGAGLGTWLGVARHKFGASGLTVTNLSDLDVCLYGCAASIGVGIIICTSSVLFWPKKFDWKTLDEKIEIAHSDERHADVDEKNAENHTGDYDYHRLTQALKIGLPTALTVFLVLFIIWPFSMFRDYIFTKSFFTGWVIVSFIWAVFGFFAVGLFPLYEGIPVFKLVLKGLTGRGSKQQAAGEAPIQGKNSQNSSDSDIGATTAAATPTKEGEQSPV